MISPLMTSLALLASGIQTKALREPWSAHTLSHPLPPSQDPFYTAPVGFEESQPGDILRMRPAPGNLTSVIGANCSAAYNIVYRTTDARFEPSWAVTTLYVPQTQQQQQYDDQDQKANNNRTNLLSFQVPYNSPSLDASPSYAFYASPFPEVALALGRGWYVTVPDHEGPLAAIGANTGQGLATLDSVRATLASNLVVLDGEQLPPQYAMWGYSGGALASEWAAELQVQYAPEMKFVGTALGGTPQNITSVWDQANESPFSGMIPLSLVGVVRPYPEAEEYLFSQLKQPDGDEFLKVRDMDAFEAFDYFAGQDIWDRYFIREKGAVLDEPVLRKVLDGNFYMGYHGVPQMPLFMYHAKNDELAVVDKAEALFRRFCGVHVPIELEINSIGGHEDEMKNGMERALEWLAKVFDGGDDLVLEGCSVRKVAIDVVNSGM